LTHKLLSDEGRQAVRKAVKWVAYPLSQRYLGVFYPLALRYLSDRLGDL